MNNQTLCSSHTPNFVDNSRINPKENVSNDVKIEQEFISNFDDQFENFSTDSSEEEKSETEENEETNKPSSRKRKNTNLSFQWKQEHPDKKAKPDNQNIPLKPEDEKKLLEKKKQLSQRKRGKRRKIDIEFIQDRGKRHVTFSKRKAGLLKKAYELSELTGTEIMVLMASETGNVYSFATPSLQPIITKPEGKSLISSCLNNNKNSRKMQTNTYNENNQRFGTRQEKSPSPDYFSNQTTSYSTSQSTYPPSQGQYTESNNLNSSEMSHSHLLGSYDSIYSREKLHPNFPQTFDSMNYPVSRSGSIPSSLSMSDPEFSSDYLNPRLQYGRMLPNNSFLSNVHFPQTNQNLNISNLPLSQQPNNLLSQNPLGGHTNTISMQSLPNTTIALNLPNSSSMNPNSYSNSPLHKNLFFPANNFFSIPQNTTLPKSENTGNAMHLKLPTINPTVPGTTNNYNTNSSFGGTKSSIETITSTIYKPVTGKNSADNSSNPSSLYGQPSSGNRGSNSTNFSN